MRSLWICVSILILQVYAIIVSKPSKGDLSPASVSYTAGFYHIPVIGISSRDSAFSDKVHFWCKFQTLGQKCIGQKFQHFNFQKRKVFEFSCLEFIEIFAF